MKKLLLLLIIPLFAFPILVCGQTSVSVDQLERIQDNSSTCLGNPIPTFYYQSKVYTGVVFENYSNGKVMMKGYCKNGKPHGEFKFYYDDGQLEHIQNWSLGKTNGIWKWYYQNGQLQMEALHKNCEIVNLRHWDSNGNIIPDSK